MSVYTFFLVVILFCGQVVEMGECVITFANSLDTDETTCNASGYELFEATRTCITESKSKTAYCLSCPAVTDPSSCTHYERCHGDEVCSTEVHEMGHTNYFSLSCKHRHDCSFHNALIGKRHPVAHNLFPHHSLRCKECCDHAGQCNKNLCHSYLTQSTPAPTKAPTPAPTPIATTTNAPTLAPHLLTTTGNQQNTPLVNDPNCQDKEEDGIACAKLDLFNICTDKSVLGFVLAHKKCGKHCGFCHSNVQSTKAPVTPPPSGVCADYEHDGINCASLDLFNLCTDTSTLSFVIAHEKCRKHCGFCQPSGGHGAVNPTSLSSTQTNTSPVISAHTMANPVTAVNPALNPIFTATRKAQTSTSHARSMCIDIEDSTFSCKVWASYGYCNRIPGTGYETAKLRCRKYCGFC